MPRTCVALLSGGLDSSLAVSLMLDQGIRVEALNFKTIFTCCQDEAGAAARRLGVRLTVLAQDDAYLELVRHPRFGYGKGANPCVDCRIYMFRKARQFMEQEGADFVVSGEVLGQRPMSQKRRDLEVIAFHAGLEERLLRPLSARCLPETQAERSGWVDRGKLLDITGQSRSRLNALARERGIPIPPSPSTGCALTETAFARKVHDLIRLDPQAARWDFELLAIGRHFRWDSTTKLIVGRNERDNHRLRLMHEAEEARSSALLEPINFRGPLLLVVGPDTDEALDFAGGLILRYVQDEVQEIPRVRLRDRAGPPTERTILPHAGAAQSPTISEGK